MITFLFAKFNYFGLQSGTDGSHQVASFFLAIEVWVLGQHVLGDGLPAFVDYTIRVTPLQNTDHSWPHYLEEPLGLPISVIASRII